MRKKIKILRINRSEKEFTKSGKSWTAEVIGIQIEAQGGEKIWINGFGSKETKDWKEGDEVELYVEVNKKDDKTYYNFKPIPEEELWRDRIEERLKGIETMLVQISEMFKKNEQKKTLNAMQTELGASPVDSPESEKLRDKILGVIKTADKSQYGEIRKKAKQRFDEGLLTRVHYDEIGRNLI